MLHQSTYIQIELGVGEAVSLLGADGCLLRCVSGKVWLTEENGGQDVILRVGECFLLTHGGRAVVESIDKRQSARCQLVPVVPAQSSQLLAALQRWVRYLSILPTIDTGRRGGVG
ncbi:DUF2917 domain-containing protein [Propionivibrio dicarboxylicus]|uniref:DUF2917 domain-containing protein n=1 Tax=Propionivibrio dicarboxylicus TaxID=83767 RepID=A0A1G7VQT2_9RHOO|nr:DUF2917 domain-containing protein [Propionivibrio dicarboxylicus]SDG62094.1 Protein of unknown function [Propionivibrio dicarboxylicus]